MEKKEKRIYEPPQLTTVTFKVEQGFQASMRRSLLFSILTYGSSGDGTANTLNDYQVEDELSW